MTATVIAQITKTDLAGNIVGGYTLAAASYRVAVTTKGEAGFLRTEVTPAMKAIYSMTMSESVADTYPSRARAERAARRVADKFDSVEIVEASK